MSWSIFDSMARIIRYDLAVDGLDGPYWRSVKGAASQMPPPRLRVFVPPDGSIGDDDDR